MSAPNVNPLASQSGFPGFRQAGWNPAPQTAYPMYGMPSMALPPNVSPAQGMNHATNPAWPGPPGMVWMPVVKTVPSGLTTPSPAPAVSAAPDDGVPQESGPESSLQANAELTPAQRTGQQVGQWVTEVLENNPELQQQVEQLNLDNLAPQANNIRAAVQQSPLFRLIPQTVDANIAARINDPTVRSLVEKGFQWLRTPAGPVEPGVGSAPLKRLAGKTEADRSVERPARRSRKETLADWTAEPEWMTASEKPASHRRRPAHRIDREI